MRSLLEEVGIQVVLVGDEREGAGNEIIYASRDDEQGWTRESVPTFIGCSQRNMLLVILFLLSYAFDKYAIVILSSYYSVDSSNTNQNTPDGVGCGLR